MTGEYLPIAWLGNIDLLYYLNATAYILRLGPVWYPLISTEYFAYFQTPGAFTLLGSFSAFFGLSPMNAMMPAQFALVALTGLIAARTARSVFRTSTLGTCIVGAAAVSAPFFRYIAGEYYFSTLLTVPVLLHLLLTTLTRRSGQPLVSLPLACSLFAHHALLFFIYPFLFLVSLPFQVAAIALRALALRRGTSRAWRPILRDAAVRMIAAAASLATVAAIAPLQAAWALRMIFDLSRPGIAGWELDVISPLALAGVPVALGRVSVPGPAARYWAIGGLWLIVFLAFVAFLRPMRNSSGANRRTFFALAGLGFLIYAAYISRVGPSYQQWKLASYVAMPYSFVFAAGLVRLLETRWRQRRPSRTSRVAASAPAVVSIGVLLVAGNIAVHAAADPNLHRFPGALRNFAALSSLRFRDLSMEITDHLALLSLYYLPGKRLHFTGTRLGYEEPLSLASVSPARPMFVFGYECVGAGHADTMTIDGVGCLLLQPPSLAIDTDYPFSRNYMFVEHHGLSVREEWGRWNGRETASLKLTLDQRRVRPDEVAYLNLELQPCLVPGMRAQRVRLDWGAGHRGEALIAERAWISLPLRDNDWIGDWVTTQTVSLAFPDIVPPHSVDGRYLETRSLAVGFVSLSISARPRGRLVEPAD